MASGGSLFTAVPDRLDAERFDALLETAGVRIERIVSTGQTTSAGEWFDQARDEWVVVVRGFAALLIEGEAEPRPLGAGDYLFIPAHVRHRVTWTTPAEPTIWLAIRIARGTPDAGSGR